MQGGRVKNSGGLHMYCVYMEGLGEKNYWIQSSEVRRARWDTNAMVKDRIRARYLNSQPSFVLEGLHDFSLFPLHYTAIVMMQHINVTTKFVFSTSFSFSFIVSYSSWCAFL